MPATLIGEQNQFGKVAITGNKIVFFLQYNTDETHSSNIDTYDADTGTWCHEQIQQPMLRQGIASCGNKVYVAGGGTLTDCCFDNVWQIHF